MLSKVHIVFFVACAILLAGCVRNNRRALDEVSDLGPFKDHTFYEVFEHRTYGGDRGVYGFPKIVVVVRKGLAKPDLEKIAWAYHQAHPDSRIDFFDDESKLKEYIELDKMPPNSPRNPNVVYDEAFISTHRVAQLDQTEKGDWFVRTDYYTGR